MQLLVTLEKLGSEIFVHGGTIFLVEWSPGTGRKSPISTITRCSFWQRFNMVMQDNEQKLLALGVHLISNLPDLYLEWRLKNIDGDGDKIGSVVRNELI